MDYEVHAFDNGIRLIYKQVQATNIAHCGMIIDAGSRDEDPGEEGLAHFIEHMLFKGTNKRKSFHVLSRLEVVGGELNAYTTKERTAIFTTIVDEFTERAVELMADVAFNSNFPLKEMEKEKKVVIEEIAMYKDTPEENIMDEFQELIYPNHPLGVNILGSKKSVKAFKQKDLFNFQKKNYSTDRMVFAFVGKLPLKKVVRICAKYFEKIEPNIVPQRRRAYEGSTQFNLVKKKSHVQGHCVMGAPAYSLHDDNKIALMLLTNLLGGPGMNSRLNLAIREKYGFAYQIDAGYSAYSDTGLFNIYVGTDKNNINRSVELIHKELKKLREQKLGRVQLHQARTQFSGQISMAEESRTSLMLTLGQSLLEYGKVDSLEEILRKVNAVDEHKLMEVANEILSEEKLSYLIYQPRR